MSQIQIGTRETDLSIEVDSRLAAFFDERITAAARYGSEYQHLWSSVRDASGGGKRIRPRFVLSAFRKLSNVGSTGETDDSAALDVAVAFELLHTAFLLHDDVIDGDTVRRGVANVVGEFAADAQAKGATEGRSRLWGETAAILGGDLLIQASHSLVARVPVAPAARAALLDVFDHSVFVTAAGELADVSFSVGVDEARLPDILAMTERKTATYSFAGPLTAGAVLAGAGGDVLEVLGEYGRLLGVAFQLGDDLLGVFGAQDVTGKSIVSDLREGKETSLIAYARATDCWPEIEPLLGRPDLSEADGRALAAVLVDCGAKAFVEELVAEHSTRAIAVLEASSLPEPLVDELSSVARSCVGRLS
ncbi:polyprenyl synthetase family protein [Leifsonia sp. NPDC058292]|uniref:polyprenyl synthetase family protein n=1 Tax=Leifsonia sp. NPDC058292 TaxID=3346428 RepID=UPI0036DC94FC